MRGDLKLSYESTIANLGTYLMNMSALGLYNNTIPTVYLPFSNVLSSVLGTLSANALNAQNITGFRTINAESALQKELNKLGYGNMLILVPEEYQKQVEENAENAQKMEGTFKKWKANYDTVNKGKSQAPSRTENQHRAFADASHSHTLGNCAFGVRV